MHGNGPNASELTVHELERTCLEPDAADPPSQRERCLEVAVPGVRSACTGLTREDWRYTRSHSHSSGAERKRYTTPGRVERKRYTIPDSE